MCPLECIWIDGMVYLWLRPPFWQTMAVIETSFCSNHMHFSLTKICGATHFTACGIGWQTEARWCHCQNHYQAVARRDPWWLCAALYLTSRFITKFGFLRFSSNNWIFSYPGDLNNRITEFGDSDEFRWVWMIRIWQASKQNSASSL
jgi:hypothetical protein